MYSVQIENRVRRQSLALPLAQLERITEVIVRLEANPRPVGVRKLTNRLGWRIHVGQYGILQSVDDETREVRVFQISHRKEACRSPCPYLTGRLSWLGAARLRRMLRVEYSSL